MYVCIFSYQQPNCCAQGKDVSCLKQPAAGLVKLALDRWRLRGMRADNISVIVVLLDSGENLNQSASPIMAKCRDEHRPKDVLHRVRLSRHPRRGLRTVLGKICRLRAQRKLSGSVCVMRSPLGTCNRLSASRPTSGDRAMRQPLRRRSYEEACNNAESLADEQRQLRVLVRRVSVDGSHNDTDPHNDKSDVTGGDSSYDHENSEADVSCGDDDDDASEESSVLRLTGRDLGESDDKSGKLGTSTVAEDDSWQVSQWQSTIDMCHPSAVDQCLPATVQCVSA